MSKERLEEIETKYSTLTVSSEKNGTEYTEVDVEDLVFLIQNGFKQAERVEELERELEEHKRYREAIERAIDKLTWNSVESEEILLKALEGDSDE